LALYLQLFNIESKHDLREVTKFVYWSWTSRLADLKWNPNI